MPGSCIKILSNYQWESCMPIYEFYCEKCQCEFERLVLSAQDPKPTCPTCCTDQVKKLVSAGAIRPAGIPAGSGGFTPPKCAPSGG
jgi:putative FmdB family regulatory protein